MKNLIIKGSIIFSVFIYCSSSLAVELPTKDSLKNSLDTKITSKIAGASSAVSNKIETFVTDNLESVKYLSSPLNSRIFKTYF